MNGRKAFAATVKIAGARRRPRVPQRARGLEPVETAPNEQPAAEPPRPPDGANGFRLISSKRERANLPDSDSLIVTVVLTLET
jgi:hypothetical protein